MSDSESRGDAVYYKRNLPSHQLIESVRQRKCLWDRYHPEYRDKAAKDRAWEEIYKEFEPSFDKLKKVKKREIGLLITRKWYNIRDSYVKSRKPGAMKKSRPYLYSEAMSFLDPIYYGENTPNSKSFSETMYTEERTSHDEDEHEESENWLNEVFVDIDSGGTVPGATPAKIPKIEFGSGAKEVTEIDDNIVTVLANLIQKEEDEDRAFFKSITPAVKSLSDDAKFVFRIQVMKLIKSLKKREKLSTPLKSERISQVEIDSE